MVHEAPRGVNGGDRGVLPISGARKGATGRRRGGEIWGIQCARPREGKRAKTAALMELPRAAMAASGACGRRRQCGGEESAGPLDLHRSAERDGAAWEIVDRPISIGRWEGGESGERVEQAETGRGARKRRWAGERD